MSTPHYDWVLADIESAGLTSAAYRTARRLLDLAVQHDGSIELTLDVARTICDTTSEGTMRSHLIHLRQAGIIEYNVASKQNRVKVHFCAWPWPIIADWTRVPRAEMLAERAESRATPTNSRVERAIVSLPDDPDTADPDENRADSRVERADLLAQRAIVRNEDPAALSDSDIRAHSARICDQDARNRAPDDQNRANFSLPIGYWLVGSRIDPMIPMVEEPTNQEPGSEPPTAPETAMPALLEAPPAPAAPTDRTPMDTAERTHSMKLLMDPDLTSVIRNTAKHMTNALGYANEHSFPWLLHQVAAYQRDLAAGKVRTIGALYTRIEQRWRLEPMTEDFRASAFYQRHYPLSREEVERHERAQRYENPYAGAAAPNPLLDMLPAPLWQEVER